MSFIESYKHLEKICGELLNNDRRISAYIEEMEKLPRGPYLVDHWNDDLRKLKQYRSIRNRIVHEPDCSEETMCTPDDAIWLDNFYSRIINLTDPLALYEKAVKPIQTISNEHTNTKNVITTYMQPQQIYNYNIPSKDTKTNFKFVICISLGIVILIFLLLFLLFYVIIQFVL